MGATLFGPMRPQVPTLLTVDEPFASGDVEQPRGLVILVVTTLTAGARLSIVPCCVVVPDLPIVAPGAQCGAIRGNAMPPALLMPGTLSVTALPVLT